MVLIFIQNPNPKPFYLYINHLTHHVLIVFHEFLLVVLIGMFKCLLHITVMLKAMFLRWNVIMSLVSCRLYWL